MNRKGFTLFELLAVLTIIGISLAVLVGAYGSWGTAHALTGATRVLEAGLAQARTLAMTSGSYVGFDYGSVETNNNKTVTGFQIFLCTNENSEVEAELKQWTSNQTALDMQHITRATPYQRLTGQLRLGNVPENLLGSGSHSDSATLFFRPDGSAWSWEDQRAHYLCVFTQERFARNPNDAQPLLRYLRIDLATGLVTVIKEKNP